MLILDGYSSNFALVRRIITDSLSQVVYKTMNIWVYYTTPPITKADNNHGGNLKENLASRRSTWNSVSQPLSKGTFGKLYGFLHP